MMPPKDSKSKHPLSPADRVLDKFQDSISLSEALRGQDAFKEFHRNRLSGSSILQTTRLPGTNDKSESLEVLLNKSQTPQAVQDLKTQLQGALNPLPSRATLSAQKQFEEDLRNIDAAVRAVPHRLGDLRDVPDLIDLIRKDALDAIKTDQDTELQQLKDALDPSKAPRIINTIAYAFGVSPTEAKDLATHLISTLKASHKAQIKKFEETMDGAVKEVNKQIGQERTRIALLRNMAEQNDRLNEEIKALSAKKLAPGAVLRHGANSGKFRDIKPSELKGLVTVTGRGITRNGKVLTLDSHGIRGFGLSMWYKLKGENKDEADLMSLAAIMRAEGVTEITMTITGARDNETAMELARKTYKACRLAGYLESEITIHYINEQGEKKTLCGKSEDPKVTKMKSPSETLFTGDFAKVLTAINDRGDTIRKEEAGSVKPLKSAAELKQSLADLRAAPPPAPPAIPAIKAGGP